MAKALSIKPPWSTLCVVARARFPRWAIKPVENRDWSHSYRGPLTIHSSKTWDEEGAQWICETFPQLHDLVRYREHAFGHFIGMVNMTGCVKGFPSKWFFGPYGFVFEYPYEWPWMETVFYRGMPGIFDFPDEIIEGRIREWKKRLSTATS